MREAEKAKLLGRDSEGEEEKAPGRENLEEEEEEDGGVEKSAGLRRVRPLISRLTLRRKQRSCKCGGGKDVVEDKRKKWVQEGNVYLFLRSNISSFGPTVSCASSRSLSTAVKSTPMGT